MLVYQITLPKKQDVEAFVKFMQDEYFPAVRKGPTRVGQVEDLTLLQLEPEKKTAGCKFLLHVGWSGLAMGGIRIDKPSAIRKFESFGARLSRLGAYAEVATWPATGAGSNVRRVTSGTTTRR